jgi:two-component system chemotaxis response regulator CheY
MHEQIKLVLIDDDSGVLRALGLLLKAMQYDVTQFACPVQAMEYVKGLPEIDVVLTDLRMPVLSGEGVVQEVKQLDSNLPVIVMSGHASNEDLAVLKARGADGFIPKPFTPDQLTKAVSEVVGSKRKAKVHSAA